jgi:hypothetical protein
VKGPELPVRHSIQYKPQTECREVHQDHHYRKHPQPHDHSDAEMERDRRNQPDWPGLCRPDEKGITHFDPGKPETETRHQISGESHVNFLASLTISAKLDGVGAVLQPWIIAFERPLLLTHIATTESVSLCVQMKS